MEQPSSQTTGRSTGRSAGGRSRIIGGVFIALSLLLAGCGMALKLGYNQGPTLAYWWLNGYVDFDDAQSRQAKRAIDQWFRWHRAEQLPEIARSVERLRVEAQQPTITPQAVCRWQAEGRRLTQVAWQQAIPPLADLALTLEPEQLNRMEKRFAKNDDKYRDKFLPPKPQDRVKARAKQWEERLEMVYGSLDGAQQERLRQALAASPHDGEAWLAERRAAQAEVLRSLRSLQAQRAGVANVAALKPQAEALLRRLGEQALHSPREAWRAQQDSAREHDCALIAQMHNTMSPAQREHAQRKLRDWEGDLLLLVSGA
ncbi:DUF6279 family lipoprotein [Aquabacterium sp. J223]|uniref:DUF6279 family lipoprotein n=1 Tax=Aquabacterium sp. J223 TaxID=2898431 RepID=UPI0021AE29B4|nr:DUF6279 family lipoprotein [Aquabacterium sp. J223]UUX96440.1 DUF6279 family lipoprotein [Aquabacterium sp. J223]